MRQGAPALSRRCAGRCGASARLSCTPSRNCATFRCNAHGFFRRGRRGDGGKFLPSGQGLRSPLRKGSGRCGIFRLPQEWSGASGGSTGGTPSSRRAGGSSRGACRCRGSGRRCFFMRGRERAEPPCKALLKHDVMLAKPAGNPFSVRRRCAVQNVCTVFCECVHVYNCMHCPGNLSNILRGEERSGVSSLIFPFLQK